MHSPTFTQKELQAGESILHQFAQGHTHQALAELRQLVADIHAAIPERQRIGKGITWVLQRTAALLAQGSQDPMQLQRLARQIEHGILPDDRLIGIPIILMAVYGISDPQPSLDYFRRAACAPFWEGREFAQLAFRRLILPHRTLVFPFLEEMAQSEHVNQRRFSAETLRPVVENHWLQKEPQVSLVVLRHLFHEMHTYPRTSVGNNLSDLSRHNPELILSIAQELAANGDPNSYWIAYRACRNLVKQYPQQVMDILCVDEYHYKDRNYSRLSEPLTGDATTE